MERTNLWILTDGTKLLSSDVGCDSHFKTLNDILDRDSNITARWKKVEDYGKRELYILTDGHDFGDSREMTTQEALDANEDAYQHTGGEWTWVRAGQEQTATIA